LTDAIFVPFNGKRFFQLHGKESPNSLFRDRVAPFQRIDWIAEILYPELINVVCWYRDFQVSDIGSSVSPQLYRQDRGFMYLEIPNE
jgi:hypothetical protein